MVNCKVNRRKRVHCDWTRNCIPPRTLSWFQIGQTNGSNYPDWLTAWYGPTTLHHGRPLLQPKTMSVNIRDSGSGFLTIKSGSCLYWLEKYPRFKLHFTPNSSSWLNLIERWFGEITRKRIRRGVFRSVPELIAAIEEYIRHNNEDPKPFVWTKRADDIIKKVAHCKAVIKTLHQRVLRSICR